MKSVRALILSWLAVLAAGSALHAHAIVQDPDALIRNTVDEVLTIVKQDKDIQTGNQKKILALVDDKVLPHFNFTRMTRLSVGKHWRTATPEQRQLLEAEFRNLLVRTYTRAFTVYRDQQVEIKPLKMTSDADEVTVRTTIVKPGTPPVPVDYDMERTADGWKVYDVLIEGVSLVTSYRTTFSEQIQQSGIDGLIKTLADKNRAAASAGPQQAGAK